MINISINLLPEEEKSKFLERKQGQRIGRLAVYLLIIIFVLLAGALSLQATLAFILQTQDKTIQNLNDQLAAFKEIEEKAIFISDRILEGKNIEKERVLFSQVFDNLAASTPSNIQITRLSLILSGTPQVTLSGETPSLRDAIKFKEKLEESKFFENVSFDSSSFDSGTEKVLFNLKLNLEGVKVKKDVKK